MLFNRFSDVFTVELNSQSARLSWPSDDCCALSLAPSCYHGLWDLCFHACELCTHVP